MEDVPNWLKSLRLHKYQYLFAKLTYEDMLGLTEEKLGFNIIFFHFSMLILAEQNVTKGARKKIASSVSKLRYRADKLREIEKDIPTYGSALSAGRLRERLKEMKEIIETPLKRPGRILFSSFRLKLFQLGMKKIFPGYLQTHLESFTRTFTSTKATKRI